MDHPLDDDPSRTRWVRWAQRHVDRFRTRAFRPGTGTFTFLEPLLRMVHISNRWEQLSLTLLPQVHLTAYPGLQADPHMREEQQRSEITHVAGPAKGNADLLMVRSADRSSPGRSMSKDREQTRVQETVRPGIEPLRRVFHRIENTERLTESVKKRSLTHESIDTMERVLHQTRRFEERREPLRVIDMNRHTGMEKGPLTDSSRPEKQAPPTRLPAVQRTSSSAPINIEHLTEQVMRQIDRRMVSWRERRGRA